MDALYLLVPLSILGMLAILGLFAWALQGGQFDELEAEGARVLAWDAGPVLDAGQDAAGAGPEESSSPENANEGRRA